MLLILAAGTVWLLTSKEHGTLLGLLSKRIGINNNPRGTQRDDNWKKQATKKETELQPDRAAASQEEHEPEVLAGLVESDDE